MADHSHCQVNCGSTDCLVPWGQVLHDSARRDAKIIRPEPDCRTCSHYRVLHASCHCQPCTNADRYQPLPPVRLYRRMG